VKSDAELGTESPWSKEQNGYSANAIDLAKGTKPSPQAPQMNKPVACMYPIVVTPLVEAFLVSTQTPDLNKQASVTASLQSADIGVSPIASYLLSTIESTSGTNVGEPTHARGLFQFMPSTILEYLDRYSQEIPALKKQDVTSSAIQVLLADYRAFKPKDVSKKSTEYLNAKSGTYVLQSGMDAAHSTEVNGQIMALILRNNKNYESFSIANNNLDQIVQGLERYYEEHLLGPTGAYNLNQMVASTPNKFIGHSFDYAISSNRGVFVKGTNITAKQMREQIHAYVVKRAGWDIARIKNEYNQIAQKNKNSEPQTILCGKSYSDASVLVYAAPEYK
jgi:hypothetical protein